MKKIFYFFVIYFILPFNIKLTASETKFSDVPPPILYHLGDPLPRKEEWLGKDLQPIYKKDHTGSWIYQRDKEGKVRYKRDEEGNFELENPWKKNYIIYTFNPLAVISVMPDSFINALVSQINPVKSKNPKEDLIKLINTNNLKLTTNIIIWITMATGFEQWHDDRTYNVGFHDVVSEWLSPTDKKNFKYNILMGLFNQNGVEEIKNEDKVVLLNRSIPFNVFEERSVQLKNNSFAHNINNANFYFPNTREVGTFWTAAISPNKKNASISFNILLEPSSNIGGLLEKSRLNYKQLLYTIGKIVENYANKGKVGDAAALKNAAEIIRRVNEYGQTKPIVKNIKFIFGEDGYREEIIKFNNLLVNANNLLDKVKNAKKLLAEVRMHDAEKAKEISSNIEQNINDAISEYEKAKDILNIIEQNAVLQIANSTPLRRFFSEYKLYPEESINLVEKDRKKAIEIFQKLVEDRIKNIDSFITSEIEIIDPQDIF